MGIIKDKELVRRNGSGLFEPASLPDIEIAEALAEKEERDKITVSLNAAERGQLEELKALWDIKSDSVALKFALEAGRNAIFAGLSAASWGYLIRRSRVRATDYNKAGELKK